MSDRVEGSPRRESKEAGSNFVDDQPEDGDTILHCGHLCHDITAHWFKYVDPIGFMRPDRSCGQATWFAACEACFIRHGQESPSFVRGDAVWSGNEPVIEKVEN